ncbi:alpha-amylase family glycosyl hydrolase [Gemmatimonas sp.]|jgi:glycosidase|uniref:alpha-amylase family glycosyl hydrolase n=1 Tax=Gemmatimonas sp. TaxID=1962908 RepID=UPI0037BF9DA7
MCAVTLRAWAARLAMAAAPAFSLGAQAPTVEKVEPPNWWANHSINPVRVLIRGQHLAGARVECPRLACGQVSVNAQGTYAFVDVRIAPSTKAGSYPLTLRTSRGSVQAPFTISAQLPTLGRFQGFGVNDVVYLLMPDRFANGDSSNDRPAKSPALLDRHKGRFYHGGDLAGVRKQLPYLKQLGITAIWMNPIYDNNDGVDTLEVYDKQPTTGYHGYGATDLYGVDEHLGTIQEFKTLVDEAHAQGIKVILDMVANHTGPYHPWVKDAPTPTWYHGTSAVHPDNTWQTWTLANRYANDALRRATLDGWFINILPDFNQDDPEVARYIIQNTLWWVGMSGMDGIRQDTWPYVPVTFWRDWMGAIKKQYPTLRVVGEVFDGDPAMIRFFEGTKTTHDEVRTGVDYLFDFPLYYPIRDAFIGGKPVKGVAQMLMRDHLYDRPQALMPFLGLHDVSRFMGEPGATIDGLKLAFTTVLTMRGIPLVYYGDEIAMAGGADPDNRRDFPGGWTTDASNAFSASGRTPEQQAVWSHVNTLLRTRAAHADLRSGALQQLAVTDQQFVYARGAVVVAINNDTKPATLALPVSVTGRDALSVCAAPVSRTITVPAKSSCVFVPSSR